MRRNITAYRQVTKVVERNDNESYLPELISAGIKTADFIVKQNAQASLLDKTSQAQADLNKLDQEFRLNNSTNPVTTSPEYQEARAEIFKKYEEDLSPYIAFEWQNNKKKLENKSDVANASWALAQTHTNTVLSVKSAMKADVKQAYFEGQNISADNISEAMASFALSKERLVNFARGNLSEVETKQLLDSYDSDVLKSVISGVIEQDTTKARALMQTDEIKKSLDLDSYKILEKTIKRTEKINEIENKKAQSVNEDGLVSFIFDNKNTYENRLKIDSMELNGEISSKVASMARRVISSEKNLHAITKNPVKEEILTQMYDLNAISDVSSEKYLEGISNLRAKILKEHENGNLNSYDIQTINKQLTSATSKKLSDATASYANNIKNIKNTFENSLPPEKVGMAVRLFFDKTKDSELSEEKQAEVANTVINEVRGHIDNEKVQKRLSVLSAVGMATDEEFLKSIGKDVNFVNSIAKKYNKTYDEVIKALKDRANR